MKTSNFVMVLAVVLVIGGAVGGSFIGGLALGRSQDVSVTASADLTGGFNLEQFQQQVASGDFQIPDDIDLDQLRQQFAESGGFGGGGGTGTFGRGGRQGGGGGFGGDFDFGGLLRDGGAPISGTVVEVGPDGFTVRTEDGTVVSVRLDEDGTISRQETLTIDQLEPGMEVFALGPAGDDGVVTAGTVQVLP